MASAFSAAGFAAIAVDGGMAMSERAAALAGLADGTVQIVCAADLISEGLDIPNVGAVILLRPTRSLGLYLQQVGRGPRPAAGKDALVVLEHAGNSLRHGLPEMPRHWSLAGLAYAEDERLTAARACHGCGLVETSGQACVECSDMVPAALPPTEPVVTAGRLKELRRDASKMSYAAIRNGNHTEAELRAIARGRGYKHRWVRTMLREQKERAAA